MKPETIYSLCILGEIEGEKMVEEATDTQVEAWFEKWLHSNPKYLTERFCKEIDSVKYNQFVTDTGGAAMEYIMSLLTTLDKNNASGVVQDTWTSSEQGNLPHFMRRASMLSAVVQNGEAVRSKMTDRGTTSRKRRSDNNKPGKRRGTAKGYAETPAKRAKGNPGNR